MSDERPGGWTREPEGRDKPGGFAGERGTYAVCAAPRAACRGMRTRFLVESGRPLVCPACGADARRARNQIDPKDHEGQR